MIKHIASLTDNLYKIFRQLVFNFFHFYQCKETVMFGIKRKTQEDMSVTVLLSPHPLPWIVNAYHPYLS